MPEAPKDNPQATIPTGAPVDPNLAQRVPKHPLEHLGGGQQVAAPSPGSGNRPVAAEGGVLAVHPASTPVQVKLPSGGLLYPNGNPSVVTVRAMRMHELMVYQTPALWTDGQVFVQILEACVGGLPPGFPVTNLWSLDKDALVVAVRQQSFGMRYVVKVRCSRRECRHEYEHALDLEKDFAVKYLEGEAFNFPIVIPGDLMDCRRTVKMRLLTMGDEIAADRNAEAELSKGNRVNTRLQDQLLATIVDVQDLNMNLLRPFVEGLTAHDASVLDQVLSEQYFGIDNTFIPKPCPRCGNVFTATMPINENFFRTPLPKAPSLVVVRK